VYTQRAAAEPTRIIRLDASQNADQVLADAVQAWRGCVA
jgi:thymidylate kinase